MRGCVLTFCFVTTFETQKIDFSYQDQWLIRLSCGEKNVKIYQMVVLEIDVKFRVALLFAFSTRNEPRHDKTNKMTGASSEDSVQPGHPPYLIRVFAVRSMGTKDSRFLYADSEDWSDCADAQVDLSLRWAHRSCCLFCRAAAQILFGLAPHNFKKSIKIRQIALELSVEQITGGLNILLYRNIHALNTQKCSACIAMIAVPFQWLNLRKMLIQLESLWGD